MARTSFSVLKIQKITIITIICFVFFERVIVSKMKNMLGIKENIA